MGSAKEDTTVKDLLIQMNKQFDSLATKDDMKDMKAEIKKNSDDIKAVRQEMQSNAEDLRNEMKALSLIHI